MKVRVLGRPVSAISKGAAVPARSGLAGASVGTPRPKGATTVASVREAMIAENARTAATAFDRAKRTGMFVRARNRSPDSA